MCIKKENVEASSTRQKHCVQIARGYDSIVEKISETGNSRIKAK